MIQEGLKRAQEKLNNAVRSYSTKRLCELFETTNNQRMTIELAEVRGAIMNELETRDNKAFDLWIDCMTDDSDYPSKFFK